MLFRLPPGLVGLIRAFGVGSILEGTVYDPEDVEVLLQFMQDLDWTLPERLNTPFVWYSWNRRCALRMPLANGEEAEDEDVFLPSTTATGTRKHSRSHRSGVGWGAASLGGDTDAAPAPAPAVPASPTLSMREHSPGPAPLSEVDNPERSGPAGRLHLRRARNRATPPRSTERVSGI